jgi:peptide deformylase
VRSDKSLHCAVGHGLVATSQSRVNRSILNVLRTLAAILRRIHEQPSEYIMALLPILEYPDPRLRTRAKPITVFDESLQKLIDDMLETMYAAPGIGLAASQVNVHQQLIVIDVSETRNEPLVVINPQILERDGAAVVEEGCLSVPGIFDEVERAVQVKLRAHDRLGKLFERSIDGLLAVCVQHEMDHLEGKLFVDYLSDLKRDRIRKKLDKDRKERKVRSGEKSRSGARAI